MSNTRMGGETRSSAKGKRTVHDPGSSVTQMRRKGAFLVRHFSPNSPGEGVKPNGEPTAHALGAKRWGESVPKNDSDRARLFAKGKSLLAKADAADKRKKKGR